ncbi:hypothetical protein HDU76_010480, partial [Blyttiomyces sp. JEL0837]
MPSLFASNNNNNNNDSAVYCVRSPSRKQITVPAHLPTTEIDPATAGPRGISRQNSISSTLSWTSASSTRSRQSSMGSVVSVVSDCDPATCGPRKAAWR